VGVIVSAEFSPLVAELVALIGRRAALALCRAEREIYIPSRTGSRARLLRLIGPGATAKLMTRWAGRQIQLPTLAAIDRAARDAEIVAQCAAGIPKTRVALTNGLSVRQVRNILARHVGPGV
jgi:Mor family transcriptional regulator